MLIDTITPAPRELFTEEYIFPSSRPYQTLEAFVKADFETGWHVQEFYEINIISRGAGHHFIGNQTVRANKGDVFIIPPNLRHAFAGGRGFDVYHILISGLFLRKYQARLKEMPIFLTLFEVEPIMRHGGGNFKHLRLDDGILEAILTKLNEINTLTPKHNSFSMLSCEALLISVIATLCYEYSKVKLPAHIDELNDSFFAMSVNTIFEKYNTRLSVQELADIAKLSRTAYMAKFKQILGTTPKQMILRERIKAACEMLACSDKPITKIAFAVGFYDTAHFVKCFCAHHGVTPMRYRELNSASSVKS